MKTSNRLILSASPLYDSGVAGTVCVANGVQMYIGQLEPMILINGVNG